jgi:hypothetical protein
VAAGHSGSINHVHAFHFSPTFAQAARELRIAITVIVVGWVAVSGMRMFLNRDRAMR